MAKKKKLTGKQKLFVEYYLQTWNATQAARKAGYKSSFSQTGYENLRKPYILAEIEKRLAEVVMTSNEVLARLTDMARSFDIADYVTFRETFGINDKGEEYFTGYDMKLDLDRLQEDGFSHLIKKIKATAKNVEVEWHDQMAALNHLGKFHKLFVDRHEHTGKDGEPLLDFDPDKYEQRQDERMARVIIMAKNMEKKK